MLNRQRARISNSLIKAVPQAFVLNPIPPVSIQAVQQHQSAGAVAPAMSFSQSGRGSFNPQSQPFVPPIEAKPTRTRKLKNGMTQITQIKDKKVKESLDDIYTEDGDINWECLEKDRKRLPCEKVLKKLAKKLKH